MRTFAFVFVAFMAFVVFVCAAPITPAAPTLQRRAEQYRLQGLKEHEIAAKFALPVTDSTEEPEIQAAASLTERLSSLLNNGDDGEDEDHDHSGDIPPGSLAAPQILPQAARIDETMLTKILAAIWIKDPRKEYAYEGKELELRRPTGMRHWGSQDMWRLF